MNLYELAIRSSSATRASLFRSVEKKKKKRVRYGTAFTRSNGEHQLVAKVAVIVNNST